MTARILFILLAALCLCAQTIDVGTGSSSLSPVISQQFLSAYYRNGFSNLVVTPPVGLVRSFGGTGLIQEFNNASTGSTPRLALVKPSTSTASTEGVLDVLQVWAPLYDYYTSVGVTVAGFPTIDTAGCPNAPTGTCLWQSFSRKYALFSFSSTQASGASNFTTRDPFFTEWSANGGITTLGPAISAETATTAASGSVGTVQLYQSAAIVNITAGSLANRIVTVRSPIYALYASNGGPTGFLGFPTGPEQIISGTRRRQSFEGGSIEYEPGQNPALRLPVASVGLSATVTKLRLKLNETFNVDAVPNSASGDPLLDRSVSWVTSNGRVISVQPNGRSAVLKAVGGGVATITAVSEGKISPAISVVVEVPCCQIGEGAPSPAASQAMVDAVTRNRLVLQLPGPIPVRRTGAGYQQEFQTVAGNRVVIALPDRSAQAWILTGPVLTAYGLANGAVGPLGYPASDPTASGRQLFEGGALAGNPVQIVTGGILSRWANLGYETGVIGEPVGPAATFSTFAASAGTIQFFRAGAIVQIQAGTLAGRSFTISGLILTRYQSLGAAAGRFGAPIGEELALNGRRRQEFEGGSLEYTPGSNVVDAVDKARRPSISVLPAIAIAGSRIRLAAGGFPDNSTLRISSTGQADFLVKTFNGAYSWDVWIPSDTPSRSVTVRAVATGATSNTAETTYTVRSTAESRPRLTKVRGDSQSGAPGTRLPIPMRINVKDEGGSPLAGVAVTFAASPGVEVSPRTASTDANGDAETSVRLPSNAGIALVTAEASKQVVTFSAQATGAVISNFPRLSFDGNSYIGSAAAILRYLQDRGEIPPSVGAITPAAVDSYLRNLCLLDSQANQICDGYLANPEVPNLWRLINFAGGALEVVPAEPAELGIRETLATGSPVLISLRLGDGTPAAVVATGVNSDGGILVMDPNPRQPRSSLGEFLSAGAKIEGALRFLPRAAATGGFLVAVNGTSAAVASAVGPCGRAFGIPAAASSTLFVYCDGAQVFYQVEIGAAAAYRGYLTDLGAGGPRYELNGLRSGSFRASRPGLSWELASLEVAFQSSSILNSATFTADYAPGTAISIYGSGLSRPDSDTVVEIGGQSASILYKDAFQVNAVIPAALPAGSWPLRLTSPYGTAEAQLEVRAAAPGIFRLSATQAAVTNQDGSLNTPSNPAVRGQIVVMYGTGFGAVQPGQGPLRQTVLPVTVESTGVNLPVVYAGLTPGAIGLYQLNVQLPSDMPPGLFQVAEIRQAGAIAQPVSLAIR